MQAFQKTMDMPAVGGGVVAGQGQGHVPLSMAFGHFPRLHAGEEIVLLLIAVDRKVAEIHPRETGYAPPFPTTVPPSVNNATCASQTDFPRKKEDFPQIFLYFWVSL